MKKSRFPTLIRFVILDQGRYLFAAGSSPIGAVDANSDGAVTAGDIFYLINFLFAGGRPPAP